MYGLGPWSVQGDILAADVPSKSISVSTNLIGTFV